MDWFWIVFIVAIIVLLIGYGVYWRTRFRKKPTRRESLDRQSQWPQHGVPHHPFRVMERGDGGAARPPYGRNSPNVDSVYGSPHSGYHPTGVNDVSDDRTLYGGFGTPGYYDPFNGGVIDGSVGGSRPGHDTNDPAYSSGTYGGDSAPSTTSPSNDGGGSPTTDTGGGSGDSGGGGTTSD